MKFIQSFIKLGIIFLLGMILLHAQPAHNIQYLTNNGGDVVAMDKEWAVVGDPTNNQVHVYKLNYSKMHNATMDMWDLHSNLQDTSTGITGPNAPVVFGSSVAISGNYLLVGDPHWKSFRGRVTLYAYNPTTDSWDYKLSSNVTSNSPYYRGTAVAIVSDGANAKIAIGAPRAPNANGSTGIVYTYSYDGSTLSITSEFTPSTQHDKRFGTSLDMKGDKLIVGAPESQLTTGEIVGAAFTYSYNGTDWEPFPPPPSGDNRMKPGKLNEFFGTDVAIDGNVSLISGGIAPVGNSSSYIYTYDMDENATHFTEAYEKFNQAGGGVDIDDDIYLMAQRDGRFSFFDTVDGDRPETFYIDTTGSGYTSVSLYKEQTIANDPDNTQALVIDIPCGIKPNKLKAFEWEMVTMSCGDGTATFRDIFGDDGLGTYGPNDNWVMYEQNGTDWSGNQNSMQQVDIDTPMELGKGYWIITDANKTWKVDDPVVTTRTQLVTTETVSPGGVDSVGGYYLYELPSTGINNTKKIMVGNPFPRSFNLNQLKLGISSYFTFGTVVTFYDPTCYVYDTSQSGQPYRALSNITPGFDNEVAAYQGFWIKQNSSTDDVSGLKLAFPFEK